MDFAVAASKVSSPISCRYSSRSLRQCPGLRSGAFIKFSLKKGFALSENFTNLPLHSIRAPVAVIFRATN